MQGNTDVAYCQAASEPVAYRLVLLMTEWFDDVILSSWRRILTTTDHTMCAARLLMQIR